MRVDVYHHVDFEITRRLDAITAKLDLITRNEGTIMSITDDLNASVAKNSDAQASVITLLNGISAQLKDALATGNPAAIQAAITQIDANTAAAAAAVVANTPAA